MAEGIIGAVEMESEQVRSLHRGIRDLVALTALPAIWVDSQPRDIARGLCDVIITTLHTDLVYIYLPGMPESTPSEFLRTRQQFAGSEQAAEVGKKLFPWLNVIHSESVLSIADPMGPGSIQIAIAPFGPQGTSGFVVAGIYLPRSFTDLDRLLLDVAANQAVVALQQARLLADLRNANELKLKFLAMISHELRTPLTSIKGITTSLLAPDGRWDANSQHQFFDIINDEADKLTDLISQLLDLSQIHAGTLRIKPVAQTIDNILKIAMAQLTTLTQRHRLTIQIAPNLPAVMADPQRIAEVLTNLVGNAVKYAPEGTTIQIEGIVRDGMVNINVSDEGPGIPSEKRAKVFEAFHQLEQKSLQMPKGAGLGLAICKGLIEAHHGQIWIRDECVSGTTISFTLPLAMSVLVPTTEVE